MGRLQRWADEMDDYDEQRKGHKGAGRPMPTREDGTVGFAMTELAMIGLAMMPDQDMYSTILPRISLSSVHTI